MTHKTNFCFELHLKIFKNRNSSITVNNYIYQNTFVILKLNNILKNFDLFITEEGLLTKRLIVYCSVAK